MSKLVFLLTSTLFSADPAVLEKGKAIYDSKCSQCHGEAGDGKGVAADFFTPRPRDFTSGAFKVRTTESGELPTHDDLKAILRRGMPHTGMPPWPRFSEEELSAVVEYVKSFNADFADPASQTKPVAIPKAPAFSAGNLEAGRKLYEENKCLDCHGRLGRGDGESGPTLTDDWGNPIRPADLTKPWTFRGGSRREDMYRTFTTGLNGTPMPSYAASITEEDRWRLVDYLVSLSPGETAPYATAVIGEFVPDVDLSRGESLFVSVPGALFPVAGQVIEDPRGFAPGVNAIEVRAVYDSASIGLRVSWHDMSAQKEGANTPLARDTVSDSLISDAVAVQIPLKEPEGMAKPYFIFGDKKNPVEIWFADLAGKEAGLYTGKGGQAVTGPEAGVLESRSEYMDGEWRVYFKRPRRPGRRLAVETGQFIPIAFSVWDGFNRESGSRRGLTAWASLYLNPPSKQSPILPAAAKGGGVLLAEIALLLFLRRRYRKSGRSWTSQ